MSFISDNFSTVSSTSDLSTDSAVAWTKGAGAFTYAGTMVADASNRIYCSSLSSATEAWYVAKSNPPASADYTVTATYKYLSVAGSMGIVARSGDSSDGNAAHGDGYMLFYRAFQGVKLCRVDDGTITTLATLTASDASGDFTLTLQVSGTSITGTVSGNLTGTATVTDSTYSAAGYVGMFASSAVTSTTGAHCTSITADNAAAGGATNLLVGRTLDGMTFGGGSIFA